MLDDNTHFLSAVNPLATVDQRDVEDLALQLREMPQLDRARKMVEFLWRGGAGRHMSDRAWADFDSMIEEYVFNTILMAANCDPSHPKLVAFTFAPPREWFGRKVPGSRAGGPNPDNIYRQAPDRSRRPVRADRSVPGPRAPRPGPHAHRQADVS